MKESNRAASLLRNDGRPLAPMLYVEDADLALLLFVFVGSLANNNLEPGR